MKKILTVSLFAMMAVSAANADIASTKYVTDRTGTTASLETEAKELTGAVNELKAKLDTVAGSGEGSVSDQIDSALEDYTNTAGMNSAIAGAKSELTTEIGKVDDKADANAAAIAGLDGTYATDKALSDGLALKQDKSAMVGATNFGGDKTTVYPTLDLTETLISEANNDMAGEVQQVASDLNAYMTSNNAAVQQAQADATAAGAAAAAADSKAQGAVDTNATQQTAINKNASDIAAINNTTSGILAQAKSYADTEDGKIEATIGTVEQGKTVVQMIADAKNAASGDAGAVADDLAEYIESNNTAVAAAKSQADKGVADAAAAKTAADAAQDAADAAQADADANAQAIAGLDTTYVSETEMSSFKTSNTSAIATAKTEAIAAAKTAADAAYDVKGAAAAAQTAAVNAAKSAADATYQVKSSALSIGAANGAWTDLTGVTGYSATGTHSLVLKDGKIQWEQVSY